MGRIESSAEARAPAEAAAAAAMPSTGRRLTNLEYVAVIADSLGVDVSAAAAELPADPEQAGFRNGEAGLLPSELRTAVYATLAEHVAGRVDFGARLAPLAPCRALEMRCTEGFIARLGRRLFRRPLSPEQIARFRPLFDVGDEDGDAFEAGARLVVEAMVQSAEFLYRLEWAAQAGLGKRADTGAGAVGRVDAFGLASRLSFLLWGSAPDEPLLAAAEAGRLDQPAGLAAEIARLLDDPRARRATAQFLDDWLDLGRLSMAERDPAVFPQWGPALIADMRAETQTLFSRLVWSEDADLTRLLTEERTEVTPRLAQLYGLAGTGAAVATYDLRDVPTRMGLLTQAGVLAATAPAARGAGIIDRGLFVLRNLLCEDVSQPPNNVGNLPAEGIEGSERDRLEHHRALVECGPCHDRIDPLGYAFETYDAIGRYRTRDEDGHALRGSGAVRINGEMRSYGGAEEYARLIAGDQRVPACLARKVLQYALGHPLASSDDESTAQAVGAAFERSGRRMRALLAAIASAAWFRDLALDDSAARELDR